MNQLEKAIEHLKENPHLIETFATQYDAVVPTRVVTFTEEVRISQYVSYNLEIPADVGQDEVSVRKYIRDHADKVREELEEKVSYEEWSHSDWPQCTDNIEMELTTKRGEKRTFKQLGMM